MPTHPFLNKLRLGVCYYPEHWPRAMWAEDLARMWQLGLDTVRVAEFAWTIFCPHEGVYDFTLFDDFLAEAQKAGMAVIMGTPTATPPQWLTETYPEALNADINGTPYRPGMRRHYNYSSTAYRRLSADIVEQLALHYGRHPAVVGWQIDNELNCEADLFFSEADHTAFRAYMQEKYRTLDALNAALGAVFWNQTYTSWSQLRLPGPTPQGSTNPHLALEMRRFISHAARGFAKMQADILRRHIAPGQFITTNGIFANIDYRAIRNESLDFLSHDSYPSFAFCLDWAGEPGGIRDRLIGLEHAQMRDASPTFAVMEQQSGAGGWDTKMKQPTPRPGQLRLWAMQSLAHGANFLSFFRWRTCPFGTEMYWFGLNNVDNLPNRRLDELAAFAADAAKLAGCAGAAYKAKIALCLDYDSEWDGAHDSWHGPFLRAGAKAWFEACQLAHAPLDVVRYNQAGDGLSPERLPPYELLIFPCAAVIGKHTAQAVEDYVRAGGRVIFGARSGYKTLHGHCWQLPQPGHLAALCGLKVEEFTHHHPYEEEPAFMSEDGPLPAPQFIEKLAPDARAATIGHWQGGPYHGRPAAVENRLGKGTCLYYGGVFSREAAGYFLKACGMARPWAQLFTLPAQVELSLREDEKQRWFFVLNYGSCAAEMVLHEPLHEALSDTVRQGPVTIEPYDVCVFTQKRQT